MTGLKIKTIQILIAGSRHKGHPDHRRDELARRLLGRRQNTATPYPLLGKKPFPVTIR